MGIAALKPARPDPAGQAGQAYAADLRGPTCAARTLLPAGAQPAIAG
jgi:hypothetical protein